MILCYHILLLLICYRYEEEIQEIGRRYKLSHQGYVEVEKPFEVQSLFELITSYLGGVHNDDGEQE